MKFAIAVLMIPLAAGAAETDKAQYVTARCKEQVTILNMQAQMQTRHRNLDLRPAQEQVNACYQRANWEFDNEQARAQQERAQAQEQAAQESAVQAEQDRLTQDPESMRAVYSASLCMAQAERKNVLDEIKKQRKYAATSGVTRLGELNDLRDTLERDDARIKESRELLASGKMKPLSCKDKLVNTIWYCSSADDATQEACTTPTAKAFAALLPQD